MLIEASRNGINVQIITRPPEDRLPEYLKKKQDYHSKLKQEGISLFYDAKVHAKLIVVDRAIAIVSSMNFYADSSAGVSWEVGLVSINQNVANSIANSFSKVLEDAPKVTE
jgi:phosphatidylserine/phosphatidylglycerophosphate/cardiolipin synthase-like enzyme